jgi:hypothetical protein
MTPDGAGRSRRIQAFWNTLSLESLHRLGEIYSADVRFEDPLSRGTGIQALEKHFRRIYRRFDSVRYEYGRSVEASNALAIEWTMKSTFRKSGRPFALSGISLLEWDDASGLISESKEFFDLGQALYRHIPLLGPVIGFIRSKAAAKPG